jgi:transposase-like protein
MPKRPNLSNDLKLAAVRMTHVMPVRIVALFLNISEESVRHASKLFEETGGVSPLETGLRRGRPPVFDEEDLKVRASTP